MTKETTVKLIERNIEYVSKHLLLLKVQIETMASNEGFDEYDAEGLAIQLHSLLESTAKRIDREIIK